MKHEDKLWAKRVARELVDMAPGGTTSDARLQRNDAKRRAHALAAAYEHRVQDSVLDYRRAVKLAAAADDTAFLRALQQAADAYPRLAECVVDWADLTDLGDPELVELAEAAGGAALGDLVALRDLLQKVLGQIREDPAVILDLVKAAADDPTLQLVLEVAVMDNPELERLARAAEDALIDG